MSSVLLLGAGASYGSAKTGTPPLGQDLARALCEFNPDGWGSLPQDLLDEFDEDFERAMVRTSKTNPHALPVLQRAMAAYFFNFQPKASNLYVTLAQRMKQAVWDGAICSLNYERFLELCLCHVGLQPVTGSKAVAGKTIELCLPHGCCHLFCDSVRGTSKGVSFSGMNVKTNGPVRSITDVAEYQDRIENDAFPPVMSYFEPQKATTSGANFIEGQRNRYRDLVSSADDIIIIGVRVRTHDGHIWDSLKETEARIVYCGGSNSGKEFDVWSESERPGSDDLIIDGYFADEFESIAEEMGI